MSRFGEGLTGSSATGGDYDIFSTILTESGASATGESYQATIGLGTNTGTCSGDLVFCPETYACVAACSGSCDDDPCDGCDSCSHSGGGGGALSALDGSYGRTWTNVAAGSQVTADIARDSIAVTKIMIAVPQAMKSLSVTIKGLGTVAPAGTPALSSVHQYFQITHPDGAGAATITFKIPNSWLTKNSLQSSDVRLYRLEGTEWVAYEPRILKSDIVLFSVEVPGLSTFAIGAKREVNAPALVTGAATQEEARSTENIVDGPAEIITNERVNEPLADETTSNNETQPSISESIIVLMQAWLGKMSWSLVAIPIIAIFVVGGAVIVFRNAKTHPRNLEHKEKLLSGYVQNALQQGHSPQEVRDGLCAHGWPQKYVDDILPSGLFETPGKGEHPADPLLPLKQYIAHQRSIGVPQETIKQHLLEAGWKQKVVDQVLETTTLC